MQQFDRDRQSPTLVADETVKQFDFGTGELSMIRKHSKQRSDDNQAIPTIVSIVDKLDRPQAAVGSKPQDVIDRFDRFFKKMQIDDQERHSQTANKDVDESRIRMFYQESQVDYDAYVDIIKGNQTDKPVTGRSNSNPIDDF